MRYFMNRDAHKQDMKMSLMVLNESKKERKKEKLPSCWELVNLLGRYLTEDLSN